MLMLDAQTVKNDRLTLVSADIGEMLPEFFSWLEAGDFSPETIWYADVYDLDLNKRIATLKVESAKKLFVCPVRKNDHGKPFRERHLWLDKILRKI